MAGGFAVPSVLRHCWLSKRKGIQSTKTFASIPLGILPWWLVSGYSPVGTRSFDYFREDAQDKDDWREIQGATQVYLENSC